MLLILFSMGLVSAQSTEEKKDPAKNMDLTDNFRETLAKRRLKEEEKEFQAVIEKGEEAVKISEELATSYAETKKLTSEDQKKLDKLEKIVKKIRQELGAEEDKERTVEDSPSSFSTALDNVKEKTLNLLSELKKRSKYSISVIAVESSNSLWKLVKFLRLSKN